MPRSVVGPCRVLLWHALACATGACAGTRPAVTLVGEVWSERHGAVPGDLFLDGRPFAGARDLDYRATGPDGRFAFRRRLAPGCHWLFLSAVGHEPAEAHFLVGPRDTTIELGRTVLRQTALIGPTLHVTLGCGPADTLRVQYWHVDTVAAAPSGR